MTRALAIAGLLALSAGMSQTARAGEIDDDLQHVLRAAAPDETVSVLVYMADAVNLRALERTLPTGENGRVPRAQRHQQVVTALRAQAAPSQAALLADLEALRLQGAVHDYRSFWIANCVRVDATPATIETLARRADVGTVFVNYPIETIEPEQIDAPAPLRGDGGPELGVQAVRAPEVWAMGFTGDGILVATLDTGVDGTHPALAHRWRGLDPAYAGRPDWAFFDPVTHWQFPQDGGVHGTHTMGTVCGGAPGHQVGVAPGAQWIAAAVIDRVSMTRTIADAILAFEWLIDPDGDSTTTWDVPHVCSNSWGIATGHNFPPYSVPCDPSFWSFLDACEAAGVVILFSAGNEGADPTTLRRPGDRATSDYQTCAVGGINANDPPNWTMYPGSSRGPTYCTPSGDPAIKPDINAPAMGVISSMPNGQYGGMTGTSMASPHVNGVIALMLEACPDLSTDEVKQVLYETALDLGPPGKDNDYGYGLVDAYAAVQLALELCSGVPRVEDGYFEAPVGSPVDVTLTASDFDGLPDPPGALTYLITELPAPGNRLIDPGNDYEITPADLPYALVDYGNVVTYWPAPDYYGPDEFVFKADDGGEPPNGGESEPGHVSGLVLYGPPQITTESLPPGFIFEPFGPVALEASEGQPALLWKVFVGNYTENALGSNDFASGGAPQGWQADEGLWAYELPFAFPFYNVDHNTVYVCSNGFLDFAGGDTDATNTAAELIAAPRIAVFWDDLRTDAGGDIFVDASTPGQVTFRWQAVTYWGEFPCNFAATLHADGRIRLTYGEGNTGAVPTIGVSSGDGEHYLLASYDGSGALLNADTLELVPPPDQLPAGLTLSPDGVLGGAPTETGQYHPIFTVTDALGRSDQRQIDLRINEHPRAPTAQDLDVSTPFETPVAVELVADDDGVPDPPGALVYVVESLPQHGALHDGFGAAITGAPQSLPSSALTYTPQPGYVGADSFTFRANDGGAPPDGGDSNLASVHVTVEPPPAEPAYIFTFDQDPGWTTEGDWAFGTPTGGGSANGDPTAGFTGASVYGYNLAGDYANDLPETLYLTTAPIDCRGLFGVELRFWRWLGVERTPFDRATVEVSSDGVTWTVLWANSTSNLSDSDWIPMAFDISSVADDQPAVRIRWGIGPTDRSVTYPGWNIDDVELWGWRAETCTGDVDGDRDVDVSDLGLLLGQYGMSGSDLDGDLNGDGGVDVSDLGLVLANYGATCR